MRAVADELGCTTSTVSQQLAVLAREAGATLIEPEGRRVRLTPAGTVRVAGFATAVRRSLVPVLAQLGAEHPAVRLRIHEHEPAEAFELLATDEVDLVLVYDYTLAPVTLDPALRVTALWSAAWELGVPAADDATGEPPEDDAPAVFRRFAEAGWIVNSRNVADEQVVRTIALLAGFEPRIAHRVDSLELVQELIVAGLGVALLPADSRLVEGVRLVALRRPEVVLRSYADDRRRRAVTQRDVREQRTDRGAAPATRRRRGPLRQRGARVSRRAGTRRRPDAQGQGRRGAVGPGIAWAATGPRRALPATRGQSARRGGVPASG
jgi:DNA-binding transcriptional LysR family regulator